MRPIVSIAISAWAITLALGAAPAKAEGIGATVDPRPPLPVAEVSGPQPEPAAVHPDQPPAIPAAAAGSRRPLLLTLKDPEKRFADAPMPVSMHDIHYDDTPQGFPATVSAMGFVQKF